MKKILALVCFLGSVAIYGQDCNSYYFLQNNKSVEMTIYDKKRNPNGKVVYTISDANNSGNTTSANVQTEMLDKKGKTVAKGTSVMKCTGGVMMVNMKMSIPQAQAEQFSQANVKAEDVFIEYPASMNKGDQLKDGNLTMDVDNNGMQQSLIMNITDRKVEDKEKITTPAGSWDCYKISYKSKMTIRMIGVGVPVNMEAIEWYAPGFGIVKTESKSGGTEITAIK
jgi:hypothetical protein